MSTINLKGDTSGQVAVVVPAVAGSNTLTLPAETGTLRSTVSSGTVLQIVNYQTGALATGTTQMPRDDTIPQITEGDQYMSQTFTPRSASSKLLIRAEGHFEFSTINGIAMALFMDAVANALATTDNWVGAATVAGMQVLQHEMTPGSTSLITFRVRAGGWGAGTTTFNGYSSGRMYGGTYASSITITEVVP